MTVLTDLELASGLVLGVAPVDRAPATAPTPRAALEESLLSALSRPPCLVSFSGGRDSSAVLAVAAAVARREGLPLPIPVTLRFPAATDSAESEWQEQVIGHIGLQDWIRLEMTDELDCVGPVATACLARHGVLWPSNAHFHAPVLAHARGGSFLTGVGGDEMLGSSRWFHARRVMARRAGFRPRDIAAVALAWSPARVRRLVLRRRLHAPFPWLHDVVVRRVERQLADDEAATPYGWSAGIHFNASHRYLHVGTDSLAALAGAEGVALSHPFLDRGFVAALAALPHAQRFESRREAMDAIFHDVLPEEVRARRTKASFDGAFWHRYSRELVARWNGEGIDSAFVDVDRLREEWSSDSPDPRTYILLQAVKVALDLGGSVRLEESPAASPPPRRTDPNLSACGSPSRVATRGRAAGAVERVARAARSARRCAAAVRPRAPARARSRHPSRGRSSP